MTDPLARQLAEVEAKAEQLMDQLTQSNAKANEAIELLEARLFDLQRAEHHGWWTDTGDIILGGDVGAFGPEGGDVAEDQVAIINCTDATVTTTTGHIWRFADCRALVGRNKLPRPERPTDPDRGR